MPNDVVLPAACLCNDVWERTFFYGPVPWGAWEGFVALRGERATRWYGWT